MQVRIVTKARPNPKNLTDAKQLECQLNFNILVVSQESLYSMDYIENILDKLKELARKIIEALLGPETEPEAEAIPIPIPVNEPQRRPRR